MIEQASQRRPRRAPLANNRLGHLGIDQGPSGRYRARLHVANIPITVGFFDELDDAVRAQQLADRVLRTFVAKAASRAQA